MKVFMLFLLLLLDAAEFGASTEAEIAVQSRPTSRPSGGLLLVNKAELLDLFKDVRQDRDDALAKTVVDLKDKLAIQEEKLANQKAEIADLKLQLQPTVKRRTTTTPPAPGPEAVDPDEAGSASMWLQSALSKVLFGAAGDARLYRAAAQVLATDGLRFGAVSAACDAALAGTIRFQNGTFGFCDGTGPWFGLGGGGSGGGGGGTLAPSPSPTAATGAPTAPTAAPFTQTSGAPPVHLWKLTKGLVAHEVGLDLENLGLTAADTGSGQGEAGVNPLTLAGRSTGTAVWLATGGAALDGTNDYLNLGANFPFAAEEGFGFAAWVRFESFKVSDFRLLELRQGDGSGVHMPYVGLHNIAVSRRARAVINSGGMGTSELRTPAEEADLFYPPVGQWAHVMWTTSLQPYGHNILYRDGETRSSWQLTEGGKSPKPTKAICPSKLALFHNAAKHSTAAELDSH